MDEPSFQRVHAPAPPGNAELPEVINGVDHSDGPTLKGETAWIPGELTYRLAVEAAGIGAWDRVLASDTVTMCPMMARLLDLPARPTTLSADEWRKIILPEDLPAVEAAVAASVHSDQPFSLEYRIRTHSGRTVWLLARGMFIRDGRGAPARVTGVSMDITDKKTAEEAARASEERYRLITDLNPDGILVYANHRYVYANSAAAHIHQVRDPGELIGRTAADFFEHEAVRLIDSRVALLLEQNQAAPLTTLYVRRAGGALLCIQATFAKVAWDGQPAVQITARDITEHKHMQDKLRITSERLKLAVESIGEGIWDWDLVRDTYSISGSLKRIFGWQESDHSGEKINWRTMIHPDDFPRVNAALRSCIKGDSPIYECEFRLITKDREWKWVSARGIIVEWDRRGNPAAMTGTISDVTARKESEEQIWRHANLDPLTGLPNRRMFRDRLEAEVRKAYRGSNELALLFLDLDGFKQVNDLFGHEAGDMLLAEVALRIKACVRETDIIARLGGDEFTVVLTDLNDREHVEFVCQKIICSLAQSFRIGNDHAYVTASIGVALYPVDSMAADELSRKADQAMYAAKAAGKNQFCYFTRAMDEKAHMRVRMSNELHQALSLEQLSIHYQPIVDLSNGHVVKAEALLRWKHPYLGNVSPSMFVPLAEETGLMSEIGTWIFREAALNSKRWSELTGSRFQVGVNKSPVQFMERNVETDWLHYLSSLDIPCGNIVIEITEGILLHASSNVMRKLLEYRDAGVQVAIDDFGTGYSSMAYLKKFDIDYLKIDRSFVRDIQHDAGSRTIVETIIVMAHKLGLKVIAEGIETPAQITILAGAGCDYGQGFFFSAPLPAEKMEEFLLRRFSAQH